MWLPQWPHTSPLASGFMITHMEGSFSGHLSSTCPSAFFHLDSFHECLTWDSVLKSGTIQRSPARFLLWAQFARVVMTGTLGEMRALGPWDPGNRHWPRTSDTKNRLPPTLFYTWMCWLPGPWASHLVEDSVPVSADGSALGLPASQGEESLGCSPAEMDWYRNSSPKRKLWSALANCW